MKVSYNWLKDYLDFNSSPEEISNILTNSGLEVEKMTQRFHNFGSFKNLVIGQVLDCNKHPNADKLKIAKVDLGSSAKNIICGAPNIKKDLFVVVAMVGTTITNLNNESFTIKKAKIRGEYSEGMICSEFEIGFGDSYEGIMELDKKLDFKVGQSFQEYFNLTQDYVFEIGLTPNRTDAFGHIGVCRDIKSVLNLSGSNLNLKKPVLDFKIDNNNLPISIAAQDKDLLPYYCGLTIQNVSIEPSPMWLKQKLSSIGISSINNIVDVTNFVLFETGNPLHAFDYDMIHNNEILIKKSGKSLNFTKIDNEIITLNKDDLIISDSLKPLCLAGIIGGKESSVSNNTKNIFLESASFLPSSIRLSAKRHSIQTDASYRFERGIDFDNCEYALKRAAMLIKLIIPDAYISSEIVKISNQKYISKKLIKWSSKKFKKMAGQDISDLVIEKILLDLDFKISGKKGLEEGCFLEVPSFRIDVSRDVDVFEEILRIYGFEKIENAKNISFPISKNNNSYEIDEIKQIVSNFFSNNGFYEIKTNSLISLDTLKRYNIEDFGINIINASSSDMNALRTSLLFGGLEVIRYNINRQNYNLLFFEFGNIYLKEKEITERPSLDLFFSGNNFEENWNEQVTKLDLFSVKKFVEKLFDLFSFKWAIDLDKALVNSLNMMKNTFDNSIVYKVNDQVVATVGSVSSKILNDFSIKQDVFFCSINWPLFISIISRNNIKFTSLPKFPKVRRDLAVLIDEKVSFSELKGLALKASKDVLREVKIFDVYRGENIDKGKKSYALSFVFQDLNKTLTDSFVDEQMRCIYNSFNEHLSAELRDGEL